MGLWAIYPGPKTTIEDKGHDKYAYVLKDMVISKPHQVWQIDITYLRTDHGFMYMNALIDMQTCYVVSWSLINCLDTEACVRTLEKAIDTMDYLKSLILIRGANLLQRLGSMHSTAEEF